MSRIMRELNSRGAVKAVEYVVITNDGIMEGRMMQMDGAGHWPAGEENPLHV